MSNAADISSAIASELGDDELLELAKLREELIVDLRGEGVGIDRPFVVLRMRRYLAILGALDMSSAHKKANGEGTNLRRSLSFTGQAIDNADLSTRA